MKKVKIKSGIYKEEKLGKTKHTLTAGRWITQIHLEQPTDTK